MIRKSCLLIIMALCSAVPDLSRAPNICEEIFNPKGWKLPNRELFELNGIEKLSLPDVPTELTAENWIPKKGVKDLGTNLPLYQWREPSPIGPITSDQVLNLVIYKDAYGRIICYLCYRVPRYADPEIIDSVISSYVCDLDWDGSFESQFPQEWLDSENNELLASIARIRLGESKEDRLVNKMLRSMLCQLKKSGR